MTEANEIGLTPVGWWVICAAVEPELMSRGGVLQLNEAWKEPHLGVILSVGPKAMAKYPSLRPGVAVWWPKDTGTEVLVNNHPVHFVRADRILGRAEFR